MVETVFSTFSSKDLKPGVFLLMKQTNKLYLFNERTDFTLNCLNEPERNKLMVEIFNCCDLMF